jgi:hypothetical protein
VVALAGCGTVAATGPPARAVPTAGPAGCAAKAPARIPPNPWPAARAKLAPAGAQAIRLCRYSGANARPRLRLTRSVLIERRGTVGGLVRQFDRLPAPRGTFACPFDDGSEIVALLAYPGGHAVTISVGLRGCNTVANGDVLRTATGRPGQPGPALLAQLERLTVPRS